MNYLVASSVDFRFRIGFIMRTKRHAQTDRQTESQNHGGVRRMTAILTRVMSKTRNKSNASFEAVQYRQDMRHIAHYYNRKNLACLYTLLRKSQ